MFLLKEIERIKRLIVIRFINKQLFRKNSIKKKRELSVVFDAQWSYFTDPTFSQSEP